MTACLHECVTRLTGYWLDRRSAGGTCLLALVVMVAACSGGGGGPASQAPSVAPDLAAGADSLLDAVPDLVNSGESGDVTYALVTHAPAGSPLQLSVRVDDAAVASAHIDNVTESLVITPLSAGTTQVSVTASTATATTTQTLRFTATPVTRTLELATDAPEKMAMVLANDSDRGVDFSLVHDGFPVFVNRAQFVSHIQSMPASYEGEPFERKLWRFLVNNTYHWPPLSSQPWLGDPWALVNSLGWGFCGEVAGTYAVLAQEAGFQARVWSLNGHVVPEILSVGRWVVYDPDLVVYYYNYDHELAGVEELASTPALITEPVDPLHPTWINYGPYSQNVAGIYASTADNRVDDGLYVPGTPSPSGQVLLPARAVLTYPGIWTSAPIGYDGVVPYTVPFFKQAKLDLPAGWTGALPLAWMPWEIQGTGHVSLNGQIFAVGSASLSAALQTSRAPVDQIDVLDSDGISIIMMINPLRFGLESGNSISVTGVSVGAISGSLIRLPDENQVMPSSVLLPGQLKGPIN